MRAGHPSRAFRAELDPPDDAGQLVAQHAEGCAVGSHALRAAHVERARYHADLADQADEDGPPSGRPHRF